jgi:hypothetical protein
MGANPVSGGHRPRLSYAPGCPGARPPGSKLPLTLTLRFTGGQRDLSGQLEPVRVVAAGQAAAGRPDPEGQVGQARPGPGLPGSGPAAPCPTGNPADYPMLSAIISRTAAPEVGAAPLPCLGQRTLGVQVGHDQVARAARDAYVRQSHGHVVMTKPGRFYPSVSAVLMTCAYLLLAGCAAGGGVITEVSRVITRLA